MGLVGDHSDEHYREWQTKNWKSTSEIIGEFKEESDGEMTREEVANLLKHWERTRHLMFWSNHSSIMSHGHILLTVTAISDPAFYYTPEKLGGRFNGKATNLPPGILLAETPWGSVVVQKTSNRSPLRSTLLTTSQSLASAYCSLATIQHKKLRVVSKLVETLAAVVVLRHQHSTLTT